MPLPQFRVSTLFWLTLAMACWFGGMRFERWLDHFPVDDVRLGPVTELRNIEGDSPAYTRNESPIPARRCTQEIADDNDDEIYRRLDAQRHRNHRTTLELRGFEGVTPSP